MNLQRREEISALLAAPVTGGAGQVLEYRDALMECRAHIDALEQTAAERVIADGSRGPTPDYTGEGSAWVPTAADFTKIELGFGRVEVGEGTWMGVPALIFGKNGNGVVGKPTAAGSRFLNADECLAVVTFANVESLDVLLGKLMKCRGDRFPNAIPADRVLGEGMVQVGHEELEWLKSLYSWMSAADEGGVKVSFSLTEFPEGVACLEGIATSLAALDALRANQGGAAT